MKDYDSTCIRLKATNYVADFDIRCKTEGPWTYLYWHFFQLVSSWWVGRATNREKWERVGGTVCAVGADSFNGSYDNMYCNLLRKELCYCLTVSEDQNSTCVLAWQVIWNIPHAFVFSFNFNLARSMPAVNVRRHKLTSSKFSLSHSVDSGLIWQVEMYLLVIGNAVIIEIMQKYYLQSQ